MAMKEPGPVVTFLYRAPLALYRARLGWMLGGHFLMLTTTGRKSGRLHRTVLEVVRHSGRSGGLPTLWVVASRGRNTDWYANAIAGGPTSVTWKTRMFTPRVHALDVGERADLLADYQRRHPRAAAMLGSTVLGGDFTADPTQLQRLAAELRALRLDPPGTEVAATR